MAFLIAGAAIMLFGVLIGVSIERNAHKQKEDV